MNDGQAGSTKLSPFVRYTREEWRRLGDVAPLSLSEADARNLRRANEGVTLQEVNEVYLPLSWLLSLYVGAMRDLYRAAHAFLLGKEAAEVP